MSVRRRTLLATLGAATAGTAGCLLVDDVSDLHVGNMTDKQVSATIDVRVENGTREELSWTPTLAAEGDWSWDKLGDRTMYSLEVSTASGLNESQTFGSDGINSAGITATIRDYGVQFSRVSK